MGILTSNVVDSNMLIRCLVLSQEHFLSSPLAGIKLRIFYILVKTVSFLQLITELLVTRVFMSNVLFLSLQKILQLELSSLVHLLATGNR